MSTKAPSSGRGQAGAANTVTSPLAQNRMRSVIGAGGGAGSTAGGGTRTAAGGGAADGLQGGSSFLQLGEGSMRGGAKGNPNFSKMVSGRASTRHGKGTGARGHDERSSGSGRRSRKKKDEQARVIVDGRDVTPQPLTFYGGAHMQASMAAHMSGATGASTASGIAGADASTDGVGGVDAHSLAHGGVSASDSDHGGGGGGGGGGGILGSYPGDHILDSDRDWAGGLAGQLGMQFEYAADGQPNANAQPRAAKEWTDKELREKHTIKIEETETRTLLHIASTRIWGEDENEAAAGAKSNAHYLHVLEKHKEKDKYSARGVQTINNSTREKEVQVAPPLVRTAGTEATTWDIFDVNARVEMQVSQAASLASSAIGGGGGTTGAGGALSAAAAAAAAAGVPRIQHESDLLTRTANLAKVAAAQASAAAAASAGGAARAGAGGGSGGGDDDDEEGYAVGARSDHRGGGDRGNGTGSNTPSVHSTQQSFRGAGRSGLAGGASSRAGGGGGGAGGKSNLSWHQGLSAAGGSTLGGHAGGASSSSASVFEKGAGGASVAAGSSAATGAGGAGGPGAAAARGGPAFSPLDKLFQKASFSRALRALEQGVLQSSLHQAQLLYRNHPEADLELVAQEAAAAAAAAAAGGSGAGQNGEDGTEKSEVDRIEGEQGSSLLPSLGGGAASSAEGKDSNGGVASSSPATAAGTASSTLLGGPAPSLIPLWSFSCSLTRGMNVSCLSWNKANGDLLAAGYGSVEFGHASRDPVTGAILPGIRVPELPKNGKTANAAGAAGGLILFWSLTNPHYPQKVFHTRHSVTSLDFSDEHPHLLAAGLYDGSVAIYDIRSESSKPALESAHQTGKHSEAVWGVKWVCKELHKRSQQLTSISTDGSVKQWSMKKGLVPHELMQLKRVHNRAALQSSSSSSSTPGSVATMEGVSRDASGLCFDFPATDGTLYFAGTEDGLIHKCSVSYNEQTLENYFGHTGPVYRVRCSPFVPDAFLSCSADWSAMLWSQSRSGASAGGSPVLRLSAGGHDSLMDIVWSPNCSTMFSLVSREGRVEIWDLDVSPLDPIIKYTVQQPQVPQQPAQTQQAQEHKTGEEGATTHADGGGLLKLGSTSTALAASASPTSAGAAASQLPLPVRTLSCVSFSAVSPVLLVGTSDGSIELLRLEGTALTSVPPPIDAVKQLDANAQAQLALQSYGQEINALTVMQVPSDSSTSTRERDDAALALGGDLSSLGSAPSALSAHQALLAKYREQARRLSAAMDQHTDTKSFVSSGGAAPAASTSGSASGSGAA